MTDEAIELSQVNETVKDTSTNNLSSADLLELKNRLSDELKILEIARTSAQLEENTSDLAELQKTVSTLKENLLEESNNISLKELVLKRFEMHDLLCAILFKEDKDERDLKFTTNCLDELPLASEIMRIQRDSEVLQERYDDLKKNNLKSKQDNIALMERLKELTEKTHSVSAKVAKNKDYRLLKSELDVRSKSLDILKNIIPRLVVGAGTSAPNLILQCGEPSNI